MKYTKANKDIDDLTSKMKTSHISSEEDDMQDIMNLLKKAKNASNTVNKASSSSVIKTSSVSKKRQGDNSLQKLLDLAWKENSKNTSLDELSEKLKKI